MPIYETNPIAELKAHLGDVLNPAIDIAFHEHPDIQVTLIHPAEQWSINFEHSAELTMEHVVSTIKDRMPDIFRSMESRKGAVEAAAKTKQAK